MTQSFLYMFDFIFITYVWNHLVYTCSDLLKHTDIHHSDYKTLQQAVDSLKTVMT